VPQELVINDEHKASCWMNVKDAYEEVSAK